MGWRDSIKRAMDKLRFNANSGQELPSRYIPELPTRNYGPYEHERFHMERRPSLEIHGFGSIELLDGVNIETQIEIDGGRITFEIFEFQHDEDGNIRDWINRVFRNNYRWNAEIQKDMTVIVQGQRFEFKGVFPSSMEYDSNPNTFSRSYRITCSFDYYEWIEPETVKTELPEHLFTMD